MGYEGLITFYVLVWMVPCMVIASAKNKSVGKAFLASLLFGLFALIYYIFARSEPKKEEKHTLKCTDCNTEVLDSDKFCPECGAHFDDQEIKCPNCKTNNKGCVKYCTKCGHNLIKEPKLEYQCEYCNKKFKSEETLQNHLEHCKTKKLKTEKDNKTAALVVGIIIFLGLGIYFLINNKINLIPLVLIGFIITPLFDKSVYWYKKKTKKIKHLRFNWRKKIILIGSILILFVLINLIIPECPKSCNDNNQCTNDFCSVETGFKCMNTIKLNCNGNGICETGEYGKSSDCPDCNDGNKCTADSYDAASKQCIHVEMKGCNND